MNMKEIAAGDLELRRGDRDSNTNGAVSQMQDFLVQQGFSLD